MLTTNGRLALVCGGFFVILGLLLSFGFLVVLGLLLIVGVGIALAVSLRRPPLEAHQLLDPSLVPVGGGSTANITVTNRGSRVNRSVVVANKVGDRRTLVDLDAIAPGKAATASMTLQTDRRGVFPVGPLRVERTDPLGFTDVVTHQGATPLLIVHPQIHKMQTLPTGHRRELEGTLSQVPQEGGISFHSLRDYEPGDDLRLIHWRSVARTGSLMVRKNIITSEPRLMVVLDTSRSSFTHTGEDAFEDAIEVAASMVAAAVESRFPVQFHTTGGARVDVSPDGDGWPMALRVLAEVELSDSDLGLAGLVAMTNHTEGVSLGVVTGRPDAQVTAGVARVQGRFDMVTVVQVSGSSTLPTVRVPGALVLDGRNAADAVGVCNLRFR